MKRWWRLALVRSGFVLGATTSMWLTYDGIVNTLMVSLASSLLLHMLVTISPYMRKQFSLILLWEEKKNEVC